MNAKDPRLEQQLKTLRLSAFIGEYQRAADSCATANRSYTQYLSILAEGEVNLRTERAIARRIAAAKFPHLKTLDTFDFAAQPSVKKQQILQLAECHFIAERTNLIFLGPCGTGKTHLSIALGHLACVLGYKVYFDTAAGLINTLIEAKNEYRLSKKMKQLMRLDLLICDELGYIPFDREGTDLLFQLVAARYEHGTTIVTTNLPFSQWTAVFHEEATAAAVIDRLVHHSVILQIQGESYRLAAKVAENPPEKGGGNMPDVTDRLANFGGYQKAMALWDLFWQDSEILLRDLRGREIARQMTKSIGSISANIEEGYGRGFGRELHQFYRYSRGSARESRGWYIRARFLLDEDLVTPRVALLDEIIGILVNTLERRGQRQRR